MGTKDIETAIFFDDDRRYADLLNGYIFDGKQVIMEKQLYSQDTRETGKYRCFYVLCPHLFSPFLLLQGKGAVSNIYYTKSSYKFQYPPPPCLFLNRIS